MRPHDIGDAQPLFSNETEKSVLGVLLNVNECYYRYADILREELFHVGMNARIFKAIKEQMETKGASDLSTVLDWMQRHPDQSNPDYMYLSEVFSMFSTSATFGQNVEALDDMRIRRGFRDFSFKLQQASVDMSVTIAEIQRRVSTLLDIGSDKDAAKDKTMEQANEELREMIVQARSGEKPPNIFYTGLTHIDDVFAFSATELEIVAAETGMGKSILCKDMAVGMARRGTWVYYISLEMKSAHMAARVNAPLAKVSASKVMKHPESLTSDELRQYEEAQKETSRLPILFDENVTKTPESVIRSIRDKAKRGYKVFYVDYIQQTLQTSDEDNVERALSSFIRNLKNLAMELDVCVIVVSQLNRDKLNPRPTLARLRGSGQLEETANSILFIWRPTERGLNFIDKDIDGAEGKAEIIVGKARDAGRQSFYMGFCGQYTYFYELDEQPIQAKVRTGYKKNDNKDGKTDTGGAKQALAEQDSSLPF